jgi:hypothetical protein
MYKEATSAAFLIEEDGEEVEYDLEQFLNKAETDKQWFRQILFGRFLSMPVLEMAVGCFSKEARTHRSAPCYARPGAQHSSYPSSRQVIRREFPRFEGKSRRYPFRA